MGDLTNNFSKHEFMCTCGCGQADIDDRLVQMLQSIRNHFGRPIHITSGFRCKNKNDQLVAEGSGASKNSSHMQGLAVDIEVPSSNDRYLLAGYAMAVGIQRIGIGKTFMHLDIDSSKPAPVMWVY